MIYQCLCLKPRFSVCRNLLVLQYMVYGQDGMDSDNVLTNISYLNSYYTLVWIAETPISSNTPAGL